MVISMVKPKWIVICPQEIFLGECLHITIECRDTKLWPTSGCLTMSILKGRASKVESGLFSHCCTEADVQNWQQQKRLCTPSWIIIISVWAV